MDTTLINSGELIGAKVFKIKSIPHISVLTDDLTTAEEAKIISAYAGDMSIFLAEIYQQYKEVYKEVYMRTSKEPLIAVESLWITEPVANQPFKATISVYIILRYISTNKQELENLLCSLESLLRATFESGKYEYQISSVTDLWQVFGKIADKHCRAIVKEERIENLQNQQMPIAYVFDRFSQEYLDLSRLVGILISHPHCAVSFQLLPCYYSDSERSELARVYQIVSTLNEGVYTGIMGNISIAAAEKVAALYKYYSDNKNKPLFHHNILIWGDARSVSSVGARLMSQLNADSMNTVDLKFVQLSDCALMSTREEFYSSPWIVAERLLERDRDQRIWDSGAVSKALSRFPYLITAPEAAQFFRFPIASNKIQAGFVINETGKTSKTYSSNLINSGDISLGVLKSSVSDDTIGLSLKDLAKHMLIVGTPGSGKTTFSVGLLDRLWKEHGIPFLVIEPAKNEYRALVESIPDLQIFTPGKNFISPFVYNPFVPPTGVKLEAYKSTLKTAFAAGVTMSTPLDKIFEESVNNCYSDFRWLDTYTTADKGKIFNIADFVKCFTQTFEAIGYTGDARNIGRAGVVRLKSLINLFDNYHSIPIEDILSKPTVIELAAIENAEQKALIIALLLLSILSYVNANYTGEGGLKNFILLEEAHVLLDATQSSGEGSANPTAIAQSLVKRMLAEIRSYGVGLAIADQSPRKVGLDIVALTDIKVAFRLVEGNDKQILADATNMTDVQVKRLAKLKPGEAFLFFNRLEEAEEIITPDYRLENKISISLRDESIRDLSTYWEDKQDKLRPYPECACAPYCQKTCLLPNRILGRDIARRIFVKYIGQGCSDKQKFTDLMTKFSNNINMELNGEELTPELKACIRVHLVRHLKYETAFNFSDDYYAKILSNI